ncbi:MAG: hypothetical protein R3B49_11490 [Phycisphaerales bacterium]
MSADEAVALAHAIGLALLLGYAAMLVRRLDRAPPPDGRRD